MSGRAADGSTGRGGRLGWQNRGPPPHCRGSAGCSWTLTHCAPSPPAQRTTPETSTPACSAASYRWWSTPRRRVAVCDARSCARLRASRGRRRPGPGWRCGPSSISTSRRAGDCGSASTSSTRGMRTRSGRPVWRCCAPPTTPWPRSRRASRSPATTWPASRSRPARRVFEALLVGGRDGGGGHRSGADLGVDSRAARTRCWWPVIQRTFDDPSMRVGPPSAGAGTAGPPRRRLPAGRRQERAAGVRLRSSGRRECLAGGASADHGAGRDRGAAERTWQAAVGRALPRAELGPRVPRAGAERLDLATRLSLADSGRERRRSRGLPGPAARPRRPSTIWWPSSSARCPTPAAVTSLLTTLEAYYACGGVTTAAAARLHLSIRAVTYRLPGCGPCSAPTPPTPRSASPCTQPSRRAAHRMAALRR